jgi:uncharacterized protein (TIGR02722 family)
MMMSLLCTIICSCQTDVFYGDPGAVETVTVAYGSTDLQSIAEKMVDSLIRHPVLDNRPVLYVHEVKNKTSEHIDTKGITDKIRTAVLRSGRARFTASSDIPQDLIDQLDYQSAGRGIVDPATAKKFGKQVGADFMMFGEIMSITKTAGRVKDVYYMITLNLVDIETGLIEWAEEKEIRKGRKRPLMGG